jgi:hypothetical protein
VGGALVRHAALVAAAALLAAGCGGGDDRPSREEARTCLERLDLHVTPQERPPNDDVGPDATLFVNDILRGRVMVEAQYYDDEAEAERDAPGLRRNARTYDGSVERHGTLTLLWIGGDEGRFAERTRDCLL